MAMDRSVYEIILQNIRDGELPGDFSLPHEENGDGPAFADGAMDGITLYHTRPENMDASGSRQMIRALRLAADGDVLAADSAFAELGEAYRAISVIDDLQEYIYSHADTLDAGNLFHFAMNTMLHSANIESVKYGLSILEVFKSADETTKEIVRRFGLSDEFTVFSVWNMRKWDNANDEIFQLAQRVHGWGRIHALEQLKAETPEIRRWMIMEGIHNTVMPAYSALTVWQKADPGHLLTGRMTGEEFRAVGNIIAALLDEGPVQGISALEDAGDIIMAYLALSDEYDLDIDDYENIFEIYSWAEDVEFFPEAADRCMEIFSSAECEECIRKAVKKGKGFRIAEILDIDCAEDLLAYVNEDFDNLCYQCLPLMMREEYVERVLDLYRRNLPLDQMRGEPADEAGLGSEPEIYTRLGAVIQNLDFYPNTGEDLVITGLWSPVTRVRNTAILILEAWTRILQLPLSAVSETIYRELEELAGKEVNDNIRVKIQKLLDGVVPEPDEEEYAGG